MFLLNTFSFFCRHFRLRLLPDLQNGFDLKRAPCIPIGRDIHRKAHNYAIASIQIDVLHGSLALSTGLLNYLSHQTQTQARSSSGAFPSHARDPDLRSSGNHCICPLWVVAVCFVLPTITNLRLCQPRECQPANHEFVKLSQLLHSGYHSAQP